MILHCILWTAVRCNTLRGVGWLRGYVMYWVLHYTDVQYIALVFSVLQQYIERSRMVGRGSRAGWAQVWVAHCTTGTDCSVLVVHWYRRSALQHWYRSGTDCCVLAQDGLDGTVSSAIQQWYRSPPEQGLVHWVVQCAVLVLCRCQGRCEPGNLTTSIPQLCTGTRCNRQYFPCACSAPQV